MKYYAALIILATLVSCQKKEKQTNVPQTSDTVALAADKIIHKKEDDTLHLNFIDEKGLFIVEGTIDSIHSKKYIAFENDDKGILKAKITTPNASGNIRFSQIIFPNNTTDGPFGREAEIELTQKGKHILVITHSQMANNSYTGKFKMALQINGEEK